MALEKRFIAGFSCSLVSSDGSVAAFVALLVHNFVGLAVPLGRVAAGQFIIEEIRVFPVSPPHIDEQHLCGQRGFRKQQARRDVVGEHDEVGVGVREGGGASVVAGACSGAVFDPYCSDGHGDDICAVDGSASVIGSASSRLSGAISALVPCLSHRQSKGKGECVDGACASGFDDLVSVAGCSASFVLVSGPAPLEERASSGSLQVGAHHFVFPWWQPKGDGSDHVHAHHHPPQQASDSSGGVVARSVGCHVVETVAVACGDSDNWWSSSDDEGSSVISRDSCEAYPGTSYIRRRYHHQNHLCLRDVPSS